MNIPSKKKLYEYKTGEYDEYDEYKASVSIFIYFLNSNN
jgi:hypothetical protein